MLSLYKCDVPSTVHCLLPHQQGDIAARANESKNNELWICMMYIGHAFITVVFSYSTLTRFYHLIAVHNSLYLLLFALACISPEERYGSLLSKPLDYYKCC